MEDKEDFLEIVVNALKESVAINPKAITHYSCLMLVIRFMIEWRINFDGPRVFGFKD